MALWQERQTRLNKIQNVVVTLPCLVKFRRLTKWGWTILHRQVRRCPNGDKSRITYTIRNRCTKRLLINGNKINLAILVLQLRKVVNLTKIKVKGFHLGILLCSTLICFSNKLWEHLNTVYNKMVSPDHLLLKHLHLSL